MSTWYYNLFAKVEGLLWGTWYNTRDELIHTIIIIILISVLPKGRSFTANSGTKAAILPKGRSSIANSGT